MRFSVGAAMGVATILAGCAAPHQIRDRQDFLAEGTRTFRGETRERVIKAAETVLRLSDPNDFEFRYTLNGFTGLRRYFVYAVVASATGREKWEFLAEQASEGIQASVSVSEAGVSQGGYSSTPYEGQMASIPLYRLFWSRVEYVLGRRTDWKTCGEAAAEAEKTQTNVAAALGGLCGSTSDGRDAAPPAQMASVSLPVAPGPNAGRKRR